EAEAGDHNVQAVDRARASGGKVVGYFGVQGDYVTVTMRAPADGDYNVRVRYAAADGTAHKLDPLPRTLLVNDVSVRTVNFPRTSASSNAWDPLTTLDAGNVTLTEGENTISLRIDTATEGHWEVD